MQQLLKKIRRTLNDKKNRRQASRVVSSLCCVIVFVTTYAMVLPAITMEQQAQCGIEAHQHDDSCYELQPVCGLEESADHAYTDACYEKVLICEKEAHVHSKACYTDAGKEMLEKVFTAAQDMEQVSAEEAMGAAGGSSETQTADTPAVASGDAQSAGADSAVSGAQGTDPAFSDAQGTDPAFSDVQGTDAAAEGAQGAGGTSGDAQGASNSGTASPSSEETAEGTNSDPAGNSAAGDFDEFAPVQPGQADSATDINGDTGEYASEDKSGEAGATDAADTAEISAPAQDDGAETDAAAEDSNMTEGQEAAAMSEDMPALIFEDTILIQTATATAKQADAETATDAQTGAENQADAGTSPARDLLPAETNVTVHVEAEEGTFPAGTSMVLATVQDEALDKVAEAVNNSVEGTSHSFQAVDISFRDASGNEIEPAKPVRVTMTSDAIKTASETPEIAEPVVLHMDDEGDAEKIEQTDLMLASDAATSAAADESAAFENAETADENLNISPDTVSFDSDQFSTYVIVYTVDFEYSVDGKTYEFSLPGGGFVSFTDLVEVLGIIGDTNSEENGDENGSEIAENAEENTANEVAEENGVNAGTNAALTLGDVEVSEAARKFVADVASVEFSSPELVDVSKAENATTVGQIKESRGLECQYSTELTEEQIEEINAQTVEAGDWALVSVQPFTSEETMTVTMKNGEVFTVKVTDEQISTNVITADGSTYRITVTYGPEAGIPEGAILEAEEIKESTSEWNAYYQQSADALGKDSLAFARFFDVKIMFEGEKIEPKAIVETKIEYESGIPLNPDSDPKAVHFVENGSTEVLEVRVDDEEFANEFTFEQGSFSVIGTVVSELAEGDYMIYGYQVTINGNQVYRDAGYKNNSAYKNSNTSSFEVSYTAMTGVSSSSGGWWGGQTTRTIGTQALSDAGYGRATYGGSSNNLVLWNVKKQGDGYVISSNNFSGTDYLGISNNALTFVQESQAAVWTYSNGQLKCGNYYLVYTGSGFNVTTTQPAGVNIYFAWNNTTSDSSGKLTVHYIYENGGNYTETSTREINISDSGLVRGSQEDLRTGIPLGKQYVKTVLSEDNEYTGDGTEIHYFLQTNYGTGQNNTNDRVWLYRETTSSAFGYGNEGGRQGTSADRPYETDIVTGGVSAYRTFGDEKDIYILYRDYPASAAESQDDDDIDAPVISKDKSDNKDGTYDISLSVTGRSTSSSSTTRANIVVIMDASWSMLEKDANTEKTLSRLQACKNAAKYLANQLYKYNSDDPETIEMTFMYFAQRVLNERELNTTYKTYNGFADAVDTIRTSYGTNWEAAIDAAKNIQWSDGDSVYVIFISDGNPNSRSTAEADKYSISTWDSGNYPASDGADSNVLTAAERVLEIKNLKGFFTIGAFDSAVTGSTNNNLTKLNPDLSSVTYGNFTPDSDEAMTAAANSIISSIQSAISYQNVVMTDGLTGMTQTALVSGTAGNFSYTVAKYTTTTEKLTALPAGETLGTAKDSVGNITSYTRNTEVDSATYPYIKTVKNVVSGSQATVTKNNDGTLTIAFPDDDTSDTVQQASYNENSKTVTWNFGDDYQLRDGYTYTVSFTVWPNQASYDLLAALQNGLLEWGDVFTYTDENGRQQTITFDDYNTQIVNSGNDYTLRSNVESGNTVTYYKVSTETLTALPSGASVGTTEDPVTHVITTYTLNSDGKTYTKTIKTPGTQNFVNPEPMPLAGTKLAMTKVWNDTLDRGHLEKLIADAEKAGKTYSVTLVVSQNGTEYKRYTFEPVKKYYTDEDMTTEAAEGVTTAYYKYIWPSQDVSIAPALLVSDPPEGYAEKGYKTVTLNNKTYYVLNEGHSYSIDETVTDYHFEFIADPYHPSLIDSASKLSNVDFETNEDGSIKNGSTANISGSGNLESFTANNSLTAELDITKKISDPKNLLTDAQEDAETFTYKVTLTVPKETEANHLYAYEFVPRPNDAWNGSNRVYAYGYQNNDDDSVKGLADDVARFDKQVFGRYTISYPSTTSTLTDLFTDDGNGTTKTGTIFITLKRNEIIRFTNLPLGTEYKIQEIYANLRQADPSRDADSTPAANTEASNIEQQGYSVSVLTKNGDPSVSTTAVAKDTVSGTITELDTRYYNQFTNTLNDATVVNLAVTKHLQGYQWSGERYYVKLTGDQIINRFTDTERYLTRASGSEDVTYTYASPLRFEKEGEYTLTFTEHDSAFKEILSGTTTGGIQYGPAVTVKIKVEKVNGKLTVANVQGGTLSEDKSLITATVTNSKGVGLQLLKLGDGSFSKPLEGVQFKLYTDQDCADEHQVVTDLTGAPVGTDGVIITSSDDSDKGMAYLGSLGNGTYYLKEITGHAGYNLLSELITITIGTDGRVTYSQSSYTDSGKGPDLVYKDKDGKFYYYSQIRNDESDVYKDDDTYTFAGYRIIVSNQSGVELPATGGPGTTLFYLLGIMLTGLAGAGLVMKRLRRNVA